MTDRRDRSGNGVLDSLADGDCRAILRTTHRPRTAPEISERCDIPLSTVYRKLDRLTELSLLATRIRVDSNGRHPTQYERRVDGLLIRLGPGEELRVSVYRTAKAVGEDGTDTARSQRPGADSTPDADGSPSGVGLEVQFVDDNGDGNENGTARVTTEDEG